MTWATRLGFGTPIYTSVLIWSPPDNPFPSYKSRILAHFALSSGVEKDAIGEDKAFAHVEKIWHSHNAMLGWLACQIWNPTDNQFPRYNLWILAHFALSSGVEKDVIGEDKAFDHVGKIWHTNNALLGWLACKIGSQTDDPIPRYKLWISAHSALCVEKDVKEEENATND